MFGFDVYILFVFYIYPYVFCIIIYFVLCFFRGVVYFLVICFTIFLFNAVVVYKSIEAMMRLLGF